MTTLTAPIGEIARVTIASEVRLPTGLESYEHATLAWRTWNALCERQRYQPGDFTDEAVDGRAGWKWSGALAAEVRELNGHGTADHVIAQVRAFLKATDNMVVLRPGRYPLWWISAKWLDVSPATLAGLARAEQARADREAAAATEADAGLGDDEDPEDVGIIGPDQTFATCRYCSHTENVYGDDGTLAALLRVHERETHPEQFWADTMLVCPIGGDGIRCEWAAGDSIAYNRHLAAVHRMPQATWPALADQASAYARQLRARANAPVPGPQPRRPDPAPAAEPVQDDRACAPQAPAPAPPGGDVQAALSVLTGYVGEVASLRERLERSEDARRAAEAEVDRLRKGAWQFLGLTENDPALAAAS